MKKNYSRMKFSVLEKLISLLANTEKYRLARIVFDKRKKKLDEYDRECELLLIKHIMVNCEKIKNF